LEHFWETVKDFIIAFGWTKGVFAIFFFLAQLAVWSLYMGRLKDRQREIDKLAKDNHEYRDRLLALLDKHLGYDGKGSNSFGSTTVTITSQRTESGSRVDDAKEAPRQLPEGAKEGGTASKQVSPPSKDKKAGNKPSRRR
jgi:hypothetical protein